MLAPEHGPDRPLKLAAELADNARMDAPTTTTEGRNMNAWIHPNAAAIVHAALTPAESATALRIPDARERREHRGADARRANDHRYAAALRTLLEGRTDVPAESMRGIGPAGSRFDHR